MFLRKARSIAVAASLGAAAPLAAQQHFDVEFQPASPTTDDVVIARIIAEAGSSCFPYPAFSPVERDASTVELTFVFTDACDPDFVGPSWDYPLGTFAAGTWTFDLQVCYSNPPPLPSYCEIDIETTFGVAAGDRIFSGGFD
jgi:hypothetical protein